MRGFGYRAETLYSSVDALHSVKMVEFVENQLELKTSDVRYHRFPSDLIASTVHIPIPLATAQNDRGCGMDRHNNYSLRRVGWEWYRKY